MVVTDDLPDNLVGPVTASDSGVVGADSVTWSLGQLASGATRTLTVAGTAPGSGTLVNNVTSTSSTVDPAPTNNDGSAPEATSTTDVAAVVQPNDPPVAPDVTDSTVAGSPATDKAEATDPDAGQALRYAITTPPSDGRAVMTAGGGVAYVPDAGFVGVDTLTYQVCDNGTPQLCDTGTVTVTVAPVARLDVASTAEDTAVRIPVLANDTAGAPVVGTSGGPAHGSVAIGAGETITYTPDDGYTGLDTFTYEICSPTAASVCDTAVVTVRVRPVNRAPDLTGRRLVTDAGSGVAGQVSGTDPDDDPLTYRRATRPLRGTALVGPKGRVLYRPAAGYAGHDLVAVVACDDGEPQLCDQAPVRVDVYPIAVDDQVRTDEGEPVAIDVVANDTGRHRAPVVAESPGDGSVEADDDELVYTPDDGFSGLDTFTYRLCTPGVAPLCRTATVTVAVGDAAVLPGEGSGPGSGTGDGTSGSGSGGLPDTGGPASWLLGVGALLLAGGAALVTVARRRRTPHTTA